MQMNHDFGTVYGQRIRTTNVPEYRTTSRTNRSNSLPTVAEKIGLRLVSKKIRIKLTLVNNLQLVMSRYTCHKTYYTISSLQMKFRFDCYVREWFVCLLGRDQMNY